VQFAEPLKRFCAEVYDWTAEHMHGALKDEPDERYPREWPEHEWTRRADGDFGCRCGGVIARRARIPFELPCVDYLTPREALQTLGTNWGRARYEDTWAALGVRKATAWYAPVTIDEHRAAAGFEPLGCMNGQPGIPAPSRVAVITDCRFVNEARLVREAGGEVWQVTRDDAGLEGAAAAHASELERSSPEFQALVDVNLSNHGTVGDLAGLVRTELERMGVLTT